jgi:hypothetical protein
VTFAAATKRGDAGFEGKPAVILGIQKQPTADTIALTRSHRGRAGGLKNSLPAGMEAPRVTFRQASFIEASITTLQGKLIGASVFVAVILFFFLGTLRPTVIALTAIPVSIFITALVFKYFGLSINTMTLGGLAIAIGGLVDDAVVGVENVLRRLKEDRAKHPTHRLHPIEVVAHATMEVRSAILYATVIIVLVFMPLFALPGMEGAVRAAGHRLHRVDAGLADGVGDGDAGAQLLPAAAHEEPRPRRHQGAGLAEGALPQQPCRACWPAQGCPGGGGVAVLVAAAPCRSSRPPSCRRSTKARC